MKDVLVGRVDLVRALSAGGAELQEAVAGFLGLERKREPPRRAAAVIERRPSRGPAVEPVPGHEPPPAWSDVPFWQAYHFEAREPHHGDESPPVEPAPARVTPARLPSACLASGAAILTRLRTRSAFSQPAGD